MGYNTGYLDDELDTLCDRAVFRCDMTFCIVFDWTVLVPSESLIASPRHYFRYSRFLKSSSPEACLLTYCGIWPRSSRDVIRDVIESSSFGMSLMKSSHRTAISIERLVPPIPSSHRMILILIIPFIGIGSFSDRFPTLVDSVNIDSCDRGSLIRVTRSTPPQQLLRTRV